MMRNGRKATHLTEVAAVALGTATGKRQIFHANTLHQPSFTIVRASTS